MKTVSLKAKKKFLMGRGYDLRGKNVKHIELLYDLYKPKAVEKPIKGWTSWGNSGQYDSTTSIGRGWKR